MHFRIAIAAAFLTAAATAQEDGLHWLDSYKTAIEEARKTGKPLFLEFRCEP